MEETVYWRHRLTPYVLVRQSRFSELDRYDQATQTWRPMEPQVDPTGEYECILETTAMKIVRILKLAGPYAPEQALEELNDLLGDL